MTRPISNNDFQPVCTQDPDTWYPPVGGNAARAKRFCHACPAITKCLELALEHEGQKGHSGRYGIWGGMSPKERADEAALRRTETQTTHPQRTAA